VLSIPGAVTDASASSRSAHGRFAYHTAVGGLNRVVLHRRLQPVAAMSTWALPHGINIRNGTRGVCGAGGDGRRGRDRHDLIATIPVGQGAARVKAYDAGCGAERRQGGTQNLQPLGWPPARLTSGRCAVRPGLFHDAGDAVPRPGPGASLLRVITGLNRWPIHSALSRQRAEAGAPAALAARSRSSRGGGRECDPGRSTIVQAEAGRRWLVIATGFAAAAAQGRRARSARRAGGRGIAAPPSSHR
jgi:hypothetical protein